MAMKMYNYVKEPFVLNINSLIMNEICSNPLMYYYGAHADVYLLLLCCFGTMYFHQDILQSLHHVKFDFGSLHDLSSYFLLESGICSGAKLLCQ